MRSTTILIVDDNAQFRALMREITAQEAAFQVVGEAADGAEAIDQAQALQPDIVLLDLAMPRVSGLEALPRLKAARPEMRVIVVTVHEEDAYRQAAAARGADTFLLKKTLRTTLLPTLGGLRNALDSSAWVMRLTAHAYPAQQEHFLASGFDAMLVQPISPRALQELLSGAPPHERMGHPPPVAGIAAARGRKGGR